MKNIQSAEIPDIRTYHYVYSLVLEKEYVVMGVMVAKKSNSLYYLVDEGKYCDWIPSLLFKITDHSIPENWYVSLCDKTAPGDIFYVSGFYELCNDDNFYDDLMEREPYAMETYFKRKVEFHKDL